MHQGVTPVELIWDCSFKRSSKVLGTVKPLSFQTLGLYHTKPFTAAQEKTWTSLPLEVPRSIQLLEYSELSLPVSIHLLRSWTLPWLANRVSRAGPGAAARSGGSPAATRVVRMASMSRVDSMSTTTPVRSMNGCRTALKESSSAPDQVVMSLTWLPFNVVVFEVLEAPGAQAATTAAVKARIKARLRLDETISTPHSPAPPTPVEYSAGRLIHSKYLPLFGQFAAVRGRTGR